MALNLVYEKQDDIPENHRELFTERNGKWQLTGITGLKTQEDVDRVQRSLDAERLAHKGTKDRLRPLHFDNQSVVEMSDDQLKTVIEAFDGYDELKTAASGKVDEAKLNEIVESRLKTKLAPIEREKTLTEEKLKTATEKLTGLETKDRLRLITDEVRKARVQVKAAQEAEEDILLNAERMFEISSDGRVVTKDGVGVTPGITADIWFSEMQAKRPLWWGPSEGLGARGDTGNGGGLNPWKGENWNLTDQGQYISKHGIEKAQQLAKQAGTSIGGAKPQAKAA